MKRWLSVDVAAVALRPPEVSKVAAVRWVRAVFAAVAETVHADLPVLVPGFGVFVARQRKAMRVRTPEGEWTEAPASRSIHLRASKAVRR